ncbi:hypothetical protein CsatB_024786 [Cannabis sativa]|uniref:DUF538 domain-containing protein n=1 Tax=Cannabis sativa TaxID=3483 RepID=A0A7J6FA35_CANSA|nr:uncharacterized protein LOC115712745 [Cannabis sativa]KAF4367571.1 hypothetical protein G4B88_003775 [Cannabis sativa]KAF4370365.1 hypothetical protein G4B88_013049 [Cannabis sativa]KAF4383174.1 hypothetical protein F8388_009205 [Cannabis sativa]
MALLPLLWFLLASLISCTNSRQLKKEETIYEVLKAHGLPMGLLPKGVREFDIDENGRFQAYLDQACNAKFESELHYDRNVSGTLSYGQIGGLSGISAQELFLWFPVKGIRVDVPSSGLIYFDVGVVFKQFSLSLFETPPDCVAVRTEEEQSNSNAPVAETVFKSNFGKLRYQLEQEILGRDDM